MTKVPTDGEYVVNRQMLVGGKSLQKGDRLPADSPLRSMPARLTRLCDMKQLLPAVTPIRLSDIDTIETSSSNKVLDIELEEEIEDTESEYEEEEEEVEEAEAEDRFDGMTVAQLQKVARKNGLSPYGRKAELQQRLREALA